MKVTLYQVKGLPVAIVDNYYDEKELEDIWSEIHFLNRNNKLSPPEKTNAATEEDGTAKKSGNGLFLYEVYNEAEKHSEIVKNSKKLFDISEELIKKHFFFNYIGKCKRDDLLLNYYENQDYYKKHKDETTITAITWLHKEPKGYEGGDMILEDNLHIPCLNNRILIFPSIIEHEVTEIKMISNQSGYGRYAIVHFIM